MLIVFLWRLNSQGYWFKKQSYKLSMSDFPKLYLATLWAHPCCASQFARLACCCLSPKFWIRLDLACVASVSVWFRSKERTRNGILVPRSLLLNRTETLATQARLDCDNTNVVNCLFSGDDFDYSVINTWDTDKSKAVIGGVTVPETWREHLPKNGSWIIIG